MTSNQFQEHCVILIHGLARTSRSLRKLGKEVETHGYKVFYLDYPSRHFTIEHLALKYIPKLLLKCGTRHYKQVHFVTHSMGGVLLRYYLSKNTIKNLGNTVMLSPPNQGSEVADKLSRFSLFQWFNGPAGMQLKTGAGFLTTRLGKANFPVGIITGTVPSIFDSFFWLLIPGENDGKVSVESAKLQGMKDFLSVNKNHTYIMNDNLVINQTIHFIEHACFIKSNKSAKKFS